MSDTANNACTDCGTPSAIMCAGTPQAYDVPHRAPCGALCERGSYFARDGSALHKQLLDDDIHYRGYPHAESEALHPRCARGCFGNGGTR